MKSFQLFSRIGWSAVRPALLAVALLLGSVSDGLSQLTFPTFSGRVVSGPNSAGVAGVGVSWVLSPNNGGISGGGGFTTTDANGNYSGTFNAASLGSGFEWRFTFTKANHTIDGFDRRVVGTNGNFVMPDPTLRYGPLTGQALSGTFGVPGVVIVPGGVLPFSTTVTSGTIPNGSNVGIETRRDIDEPGFITDLTVTPLINHTRAGDLDITLIHPDGTSVILRKTSPDNSAYSNPTYSIAANNSHEPLSVLLGKSPSGIWKLVVRDPAGGSGSAGTITGWNLNLTRAAVVTDANGNFNAGIGKNYRSTPTHPRVSSFTSTTTDIPGGVPTIIRVNQGTILGSITTSNSTTAQFLPNVKVPVYSAMKITVQQPPGNTSDSSWAVPNTSSGTYDLTSRTLNGSGFTQHLILGNSNATVVPRGRGMTFSPASITTYAGASSVNFTLVASPPVLELPATVTMDEDQTFYGTLTSYDLEQEPGAISVTASSDNPQLISGSGILVAGALNFTGSRPLVLTPIPNQYGSANITVIASDGVLRTTNSFVLVVNPVSDNPTAGTAGALNLDGVDDYVAVSPGPVIPTSGNFTVEAWAYLNPGTTGYREILSQGTGGNAFYIGMGANGLLRAGDTWQNPANLAFPVGVWTHFAVVKSNNTARLYTNGVLVASIGSGVTNPAATEFRIGRQYGTATENWAGRIDEVRVWNTARADSDIRRTMTVPLVGNESGLQAYYRFEEASGIIAYDFAPNTSTQNGPQDGYLRNDAGWTSNSGINANLGIHRYTVDEDTATSIYLTGFDVDGRPGTTNLTYSIVTPPTRGTLSLNTGLIHVAAQNPITYLPATNYIGGDSFVYRVTDANNNSAIATVSINVANVNDIPTISAIPDQLIIEDTTNVIAFVVNDSDANQVKADLAVTVVFESGGTVPIQTNWVVTAGNGINRTLYIVPAKGEIGNVIVTVSVRDTPGDSASSTFELSVIPKPAYAVRDIGTLPGWSTSYGMAINEQGQVAGYASRNSSADGRAFRFNGILDGSTLIDLGAASGSASYAYGINNAGEITGSVIEGGALPQAFVYRNGTFTKLGFPQVGNRSEGRSINALGQIVGFGNLTANGVNRALIYTNGVWGALPLFGPQSIAEEGYAINDSGIL